MKKKYTLTVKALFLTLVVACGLHQDALSQMPQYYYYAYTPTNVGIYFGAFNPTSSGTSSVRRSQFLYYPSDFNQPPVAGAISAVYVYSAGTVDTAAYTNLVIKLGMTTNTSFTGGAWSNVGMDTVLYVQQDTFFNVKWNDWVRIPLDKPFNYNGTSNLIFEVYNTANQGGFSTRFDPPSTVPGQYRQQYGPVSGPATFSGPKPPILFGMDICTQKLSVDIGKDTCIGFQEIKLDARTPRGVSYEWNNGSTDSILQVKHGGTYYVTVTTADGCLGRDTVHILQAPVVNIADTACGSYTFHGHTYTKTGVDTVVLPATVGSMCDSIFILNLTMHTIIHPVISVNHFDLSTATAYVSYQWLLNGAVIPGATADIYTVTQNGDYQVVVTNEEGCRDTSDVYKVTNYTGIDDVRRIAGQIRIYPNPAKGMVHIDAPVPVQTTITGLDGRVLKQAKGVTTLMTQDLAAGMYLVQIRDEEGRLLKVVPLVCAAL